LILASLQNTSLLYQQIYVTYPVYFSLVYRSYGNTSQQTLIDGVVK